MFHLISKCVRHSLLPTIVFLSVASTLWAQQKDRPLRARFRVTLNGFIVNRETADDVLERDGKRDEVFVLAQIFEYGPNGRLRSDSGVLRTPVMGDPTNRADRIRAGSTPANSGVLGIGASEAGGLRTGDRFPAGVDLSSWPANPQRDRLPMLLWEGELVDIIPATPEANTLMIVVTIWEWDGPLGGIETSAPAPAISTNDVNFFFTRIILLPSWLTLELPPAPCLMPPCMDKSTKRRPENENPYPWDRTLLRVREVDPTTVELTSGGLGSNITVGKGLLGDPRNRPVGMRDAGDHYQFESRAVILNYNVAHDTGAAQIRYRDADALQGDYTLIVGIERRP